METRPSIRMSSLRHSLSSSKFQPFFIIISFFPKIVEIQALMKYYDKSGDGKLSYEEFVNGLREPLNERRLSIVKKAFASLDKSNMGKISVT